MRTRFTATLLALGLAATGCAGDSESVPGPTSPTATITTTTTSTPTTTTSPGPTTTHSPATTATTDPAPATATTTTATTQTTRYVVLDPSIFPADPLPGSDGASGSGCSPGPGDLPSGVWYGQVLAKEAGSVQFDLTCFYFGEIAWEIAAQSGDEAPNDYWIVNDNPTLRTVPVAATAVVWSIPGDLSDPLRPLSFITEWPPDLDRAYAACPGDFCGVWLYVNDGVADEIVEQYVP